MHALMDGESENLAFLLPLFFSSSLPTHSRLGRFSLPPQPSPSLVTNRSPTFSTSSAVENQKLSRKLRRKQETPPSSLSFRVNLHATDEVSLLISLIQREIWREFLSSFSLSDPALISRLVVSHRSLSTAISRSVDSMITLGSIPSDFESSPSFSRQYPIVGIIGRIVDDEAEVRRLKLNLEV